MRFAVVSFRLGGPDGVSVEAGKWQAALDGLGYDSYRVAGAFGTTAPGDITVEGLGYSARDAGPDISAPPERDELESALAAADVVIVENMFGLPLHEGASALLARVLADRPAIGHHHDLPSQRPEWSRLPEATVSLFPPDLPRMAHVTINDVSARELASRGIGSRVIRNTFDPDPAPGSRAAGLRAALGLDRDPAATLALMPSRVVPRKNAGRALTFCDALQAAGGHAVVLLVTGPVEDGHLGDFTRACATSAATVAHRPAWFGPGGAFTIADAYTACDVVVFASDWEGFGNPVMESIAHARPLVVSPYPVLRELEDLGFRFTHLGPDPTAAVDDLIGGRTEELIGPNQALLAKTLSPESLAGALRDVINDLV